MTVIHEIDNKRAGDVFLEWTGLSLPWSPKDVSAYALAFDERLVDFKGMGDDGELICFASTAADFGCHEAKLVHVKPSGVVAAVQQVARRAKDAVGFEIRAALVVICAGTSGLFTDQDFERINDVLKELGPEVLTMFSLGEQGNSNSGSESFHGNNMLNFLFFG